MAEPITSPILASTSQAVAAALTQLALWLGLPWPRPVEAIILLLALLAGLVTWQSRRQRRRAGRPALPPALVDQDSVDTVPATADVESPRDAGPGPEVGNQLIGNMRQSVMQMDLAGVIQYANPECEQMLRLPLRHIRGRVLPDLCIAADRSRVLTLLRQSRTRDVDPVLARMPRRNEVATVELWISAIHGLDGAVQGFSCLAIDVTGRQQARERLQDKLDFAARLIDISPTPLFAKDAEGRYTEVNRAWLDMTGLPLNRVMGKTSISIFGDPKGQSKASDDHVMQTGETVSYDYRLVAADGTERETVVVKSLLNRGDGSVAGVVGSLTDVTAYREAERAIREARDQSVRAAKAKIDFERSFLSMAAHELRTPLTSLRLQTQVLVKATDETARRALCGELLSSVDRIAHVLEQLMILSRVDGLKYSHLDIVDVDLSAVYFKVMSSVQEEAAERQLTMKADLRGMHVQGVEFGIYTLVRNLLHNAILYTPAGGKVLIAAKVTEAGTVLTVEDSGPGIPESQREQAFDRFHRLGQQTVKGSGLGLSIVKTIADLHGASVTLGTSRLGGLLVTVAFQPHTPEVREFLDSDLTGLNSTPGSLDQGRP